ncbi:MAG: hypothetical protein M1399_08975 [Actinobacteria bacterium]|nr:hypothetical protein [Actinomycetota bacterium]MCL5446880.1 hypothetical protein [Actinomycetota bacterium]
MPGRLRGAARVYGALGLLVVAMVAGVLVGVGTSSPVPGSTLRQAGDSQVSPSMTRSLQRQVTCGGCVPAEGGVRLLRDLSVAKRVNLRLGDLTGGWRQVMPAQEASSDKTLAMHDLPAALQFASCMHLSAREKADELYNANQVLNIGSPTFGPTGSNPLHKYYVALSSWVDMTAKPFASYFMRDSSLYKKCAPALWAAMLSTAADSGTQAGSVQFKGGNVPEPASMDVRRVSLPDGAHGLITEVGAPGIPYAYLLASMEWRRVQSVIAVTFGDGSSGMAAVQDLSKSPLPGLAEKLLVSMVVRTCGCAGQ